MTAANRTLTPEQKSRALSAMRKVAMAIFELSEAYEAMPALNDEVDLHPLVPRSLDEWARQWDDKCCETADEWAADLKAVRL